MANTYTDEQRTEALTLYEEHGTAETNRRTGVPSRTLRRWANTAGVAAARELALIEGGARLNQIHEVLRAEARVLMAEKIVDLLERIDEPHTEYKAAGKELHTLKHPVATSTDVRNYVTSIKALVESYRLEMGEATGRIETTSKVDAELERMAREFNRSQA